MSSPAKPGAPTTLIPPVALSHPGLQTEYNHDLRVSETFLQSHEPIRDALRDDRLLAAFDFYESQAKSHKRMFHALGLWSLILGLLTLASAAMAAMTGQSLIHAFGSWWVAAEGGSAASLILVLWNRLRRHRVLWCQAVFCRERVRQWHFQVLLDGQVMCLLPLRRDEFKTELDRRWGVLQQNLLDGYGMMIAFMRHGSRKEDFMHEVSTYGDPELGKVVLHALQTLRFEHQLRFSHRKIEPEAEQAGMALEERTGLSESVATFTLAGAVLVGAFGFFVALSEAFPSSIHITLDAVAASRILGGSALLLSVLSAASRAYRAGYTLPDESESYEEYSDRIRESKAVFDNASTGEEKFRQLSELEAEAAAELRRFLKMKMRATFIF
jgi:hypothetical protein